MRSLVIYINTSIIHGNKPEFLSTILERYKQVYLAQEGASKDIQYYSMLSHLPKI